MTNLLLVAIGGSIGASSRYLFYLIFKNYLFTNYYFVSTFLVNIIGSFLIGYIISVTESKNLSEDFIKYFIIIGILGSFTTFSTFSFETIELLSGKKFLIAFCYIFLTLSLCLLFTFIGLNFNKLLH